ncbi:MAG: hypothetical protein H0W18_17550, partial [Acidobacteria bacterium]|nr:hypothetical protein [Acidobacteriota bacterium]
LGCNLRIVRLANVPCKSFTTNTIREFGAPYELQQKYSFHEVAATTVDGRNIPSAAWDGFLMVDTDENPSRPPSVAGLPTAMPFRPRKKNGYFSRLVPAGAGMPVADWFGGEGIRYPDERPSGIPPVCDETRECLKQYYLALTRRLPRKAEDSVTPTVLLGQLSPFIVVARTIPAGSGNERHNLHYFVIRSLNGSNDLYTVSLVEAATAEAAQDLFLGFAADFSVPLEPVAIGDLGLQTVQSSKEVLFVRGRAVVQVVPNKPGTPVEDLALSIDKMLSAPTP